MFGIRQWFGFILLYVTVQYSQHHLLKRLFFLHCIICSFVINCPYMCEFISGASLLISVLNLGQYHTFLITVTLQDNLKSGGVIPPNLFFFLKIILGIWGLTPGASGSLITFS